jgi:hypothetical protein
VIRLSNLSRDQGQRWCGAASVKPHRTVLLTDRTALIAGWGISYWYAGSASKTSRRAAAATRHRSQRKTCRHCGEQIKE